jgi:predicted CopG family antitoxin
MPVKTTVILKDEIYEHLVKKYGRRKISKTINEVLMKQFSGSKKSMYGADPWLTVKALRDEKELHETS